MRYTNHHIGGSVNTINQGVTATIDVIKLALGDRVVHVDGREQKLTVAESLVQSVNTWKGKGR